MNKVIWLILSAFLIAGIGFLILILVLPGKEFTIENQTSQPEITLLLVGDIMLNRGIEYMIEKEGKGDFSFPFFMIKDHLDQADLVFGNLEGPISDKGEKVGSIYSFRAEPQAVNGLKYAGFDILSLANNHMLDYQRIALEDTMQILKENGIDYVGAGFNKEEAFSLKIKEIKDTKIGFLAYTDLGPATWQATDEKSGMAWLFEEDIEEVKKDIENAKEKVDVLIISLHSGEEYQSEPTASQIKLSQIFVDSGADLIVGHHPHVVQKMAKYQTGLIFYSLGNFVFDQAFSQETQQALLLEIVIKNGKIEEANLKEIRFSPFFQPYFE